MSGIKLGYEIDTGNEICFKPSHMMVTGITNKSGKTTTLEAIAERSNKKIIVFKTKRGEKVFMSGHVIPPYFKDRSDWEFVKSIIEATLRSKIRHFEQIEIIKICEESGNSLFQFKQIIDDRLAGKTKKKLTNFESNILVGLRAYLEKALDKLKDIPFSNELDLYDGVNIIDLEQFHDDDALISLIISSVVSKVQTDTSISDTITIIPEAWRFLPQERNNPCKLPTESLIRQGATNGNFVWIDSQDIAGVDKSIIKQVTEYLLGYQAERNEVKHTLDQIPLANNQKPKADEIMNLQQGQFYLASRDLKAITYVQPVWMDDDTSIKIARGLTTLSDINIDKMKKEYYSSKSLEKIEHKKTKPVLPKNNTENKLSDETLDYVDKMVGKLQRQLDELKNEVHSKPSVNKNEIVKEVLSKVPSSANPIYKIAPLEKIKKDFINDAKEKILGDISKLSDDAKMICKYLESRGVGVSVAELVVKCLKVSKNGQSYDRVKSAGAELSSIGVVKKQTNGNYKPELKSRINELMAVHEPSDDDIENLYNHVLVEIIGEKLTA